MVVGVGIDIEEVGDFLEKPFAENEVFYRRIFSQAEIDYCLKHKNWAQRFCARFCAKEAMVKASSSFCRLVISDISVGKKENGRPRIFLERENLENKSLFEMHDIHVSLSHTEHYASAMIVIEKKQEKEKNAC